MKEAKNPDSDRVFNSWLSHVTGWLSPSPLSPEKYQATREDVLQFISYLLQACTNQNRY